MEELDVVPPVTAQVSETPPPSDLLSEQDKRVVEANGFIQKAKTILGTIFVGTLHMLQEVFGIIFQR